MMLNARQLTIGTLIRVFPGRIILTQTMMLFETGVLALIPLFIGFAIDGLLDGELTALWHLAGLMAGLIAISVVRRLYDTRAYGTIRVELGKALTERSEDMPVSTVNARMGMVRELVDFLEETMPEALSATVQLAIAVIILYSFSPILAAASGTAAVVMALIYAVFHRRFFHLNGALNRQTERQVKILQTRKANAIAIHLGRLRRLEVSLSDTEAVLYGLIFIVLLGMILFNLWYAATALTVSVGTIFSIINYSWEFVQSALALPITLQSWSRLAEITQRINASESASSEL